MADISKIVIPGDNTEYNVKDSDAVRGSGTSGYLAKFTDSKTLTAGPQLGSSTSTFLRNDGTWDTPDGKLTSVIYNSGIKRFEKTINGVTSNIITISTLKSELSLSKSDVGLGNVANAAQVTNVTYDSTNNQLKKTLNGATVSVLDFDDITVKGAAEDGDGNNISDTYATTSSVSDMGTSAYQSAVAACIPRPRELWTNGSPSSAVAADTTFSSNLVAAYSLFMIVCAVGTSGDNAATHFTSLCRTGETTRLLNAAPQYSYRRDITISDDTVTFGAGYRVGTTNTEYNSNVIPLALYGLY